MDPEGRFMVVAGKIGPGETEVEDKITLLLDIGWLLHGPMHFDAEERHPTPGKPGTPRILCNVRQPMWRP